MAIIIRGLWVFSSISWCEETYGCMQMFTYILYSEIINHTYLDY